VLRQQLHDSACLLDDRWSTTPFQYGSEQRRQNLLHGSSVGVRDDLTTVTLGQHSPFASLGLDEHRGAVARP
jgi:hypothetical protein